MSRDADQDGFRLLACRELLETHPESLRIKEQVDALEEAMPDRPGVVVSFCRTILESTCKTIIVDRGMTVDSRWDAQKLLAESLKYLDLGARPDGGADSRLRAGVESLVRGVTQIVGGVATIRNAHGSAAHGGDAYEPLLDARYAEIIARSTDAAVGLLFRTHLLTAKRDPLERFRYADHADFDEFIDASYGPFEVLAVPLVASEALYYTDFEAYRAGLMQWMQDVNGSNTAAAEGDPGDE